MNTIKPSPNNIAPLIPAATVILLRDKVGGIETLMLRRNRALKSFAGAWVFPGGRVDPNDAPGATELNRAKAAAIREAEEETGLVLRPDNLIPLSRWIPPVEEKRRFSTWFFIAKAPDAPVQIDDGEIKEFKWMCPRALVSATPNPDQVIFPPTFVSLHQLMTAQSADMACEDISRADDEYFETRFNKSQSDLVVLWQRDSAYESEDLNAAGPRHRLVMGRKQWTYLNT